MYLEYFGLKEHPFRLTPDIDFLYMSRSHARAKAYMDYTIMSQDGFVVVTGEIGSGKTTLINKLMAELPEEFVIAKIFQTQINETELLQDVLAQLGIERFDAGKVELLKTLEKTLIEHYQNNRRVILIVDEAQNLTDPVLEEIRLLSGFETRKQKLLSIILAGQPELAQIIESPEKEQFLQRVRLRFHLGPLSETETYDYIVHRLSVAGARTLDIFPKNTMPLIYKYTGGIPRLINAICDMSLLTAFVDNAFMVSNTVIETAVEELRWVPFEERASQLEQKRRASTLAPSAPALAVSGDDIKQLAAMQVGMDELVKAVNGLGDQLGKPLSDLAKQIEKLVKERA